MLELKHYNYNCRYMAANSILFPPRDLFFYHGRVTANYALLHRIVLEMASRAVRLFLSLQLRLRKKMGFQGGAPRENL